MRARFQGITDSPKLVAALKASTTTVSKANVIRNANDRSGKRLSCDPSVSLDELPCLALPSLLAGPSRLLDRQTSRRDRRTSFAVSTVWHVPHASGIRRVIQRCDGHACPSSAIEQVATATLWMATVLSDATSRTRRIQRVLHEEGNARQRPAARRESHCHH